MSMKVSHRWVAIAGVAAAAAVASGTMLLHHDQAGPSWDSAQAMAKQAGCFDTFQHAATFAGTRDAGSCQVQGQRVDFVIVDDSTTAAAWWDGYVQGHGDSHEPGIVGEGWVAHTPHADTLNRIAQHLT